MKQPEKLLVAIVFGLGSLSLSAAYADDNENEGGSTTTSSSCTRTVVNACGLNLVKFSCTNTAQISTDDDPDENSEHQDGEDNNRGGDVDNHGHHYSDDDHTPPSSGSSGKSSDFQYTDSHGVSHQVDHSQRMGTSPDNKLTICHRMGGARVTLNVPDDQVNGYKAHGHGKHDMDTIGRCEDEDDGEGNDDPAKVAAAPQVSQSTTVTSSVAACLAALPSKTVVMNGVPMNGAGCNASGVSCQIQYGGGASGNPLFQGGAPNRGGVRTLH